MNTQWKKLFKVAVVGGGLILASASAHAQSVSFGTNAKVDLGDVKAAHSSQGSVAVDGSNVNASGSVADGLRVGSSTVTTGVQGAVSVPAAAVAAALAD
jgi:hypothetical protein